MANLYKGKHILITGATGGLGSALTLKLSELGAVLVVSDRDEKLFSDLQTDISSNSTVTPISADLSIPGEAEILAINSLKAVGHIDILINNAGIAYHALLSETTETRMRAVYEINAFSPISLTKKLLTSMKKRGDGIIINILSCAGFIPTPTTGIYGASKAAFSSMARTLRLEVEPDGIRVFNFYPGPIATLFNENALRENDRDGLFACGTVGEKPEKVVEKILSTVGAQPGDIWLSMISKWLALTGTIWPKLADHRLSPIRDEIVTFQGSQKSPEKRR